MFLGIGESVYDILFKDNQPIKGVPGGSVFNTMISLGRLGHNPVFISEIGVDKIGELIVDFMSTNGVKTDNLYRFHDGKTPVSMAFLDEKNEDSYDFYMQYPKDRREVVLPNISTNDVCIYGSFYSLTPSLMGSVVDILESAGC